MNFLNKIRPEDIDNDAARGLTSEANSKSAKEAFAPPANKKDLNNQPSFNFGFGGSTEGGSDVPKANTPASVADAEMQDVDDVTDDTSVATAKQDNNKLPRKPTKTTDNATPQEIETNTTFIDVHLTVKESEDPKDYSEKEFLKEIAAQRNLFGIHRDDLELFVNDQAAKKFASQGQQKFTLAQ